MASIASSLCLPAKNVQWRGRLSKKSSAQRGRFDVSNLLRRLFIRGLMPHHEKHPKTGAVGEITHVFAHRFVLQTDSKTVLADLTPHGLERVGLRVGDRVSIEGEQKPSEIKISRLERNGETFEIGDGPRSEHKHPPADPALATKAATNAGYEVIGELRRKPKHFEALGKKEGLFAELHIELDGDIRKTKPVSPEDDKWRSEIEAARASRS